MRELPQSFGHFGSCVALSLLSLLSACGKAPLQPREPEEGEPHYSVATFNVHFLTEGDAATAEAVGQTGADFVFLQETDPSWEAALTERYATEYPYMRFSVDAGPRGLAVLSRFPIEDYRLLEAPNDWHPGARVVIDTPGGLLQVMHLHLRSKFEGESNPLSDYFTSGRDHVVEMKHFFEEWEPMPTLVVGDFNEDPSGDSVNWLEARGFRNALPLYHPGQFTWAGRSVANQFTMTIDHILFDESFIPLDARISKRGNSDHYPVVAHFQLERPEQEATEP